MRCLHAHPAMLVFDGGVHFAAVASALHPIHRHRLPEAHLDSAYKLRERLGRTAAGAEEFVRRLRIALHQRIPTGLGSFSDDVFGAARVYRCASRQKQGDRDHRDCTRRRPPKPAFTQCASVLLWPKTIQVDSPRQTNSEDFYNSVLFLQQSGKLTTPKALGFNAFGGLLKPASRGLSGAGAPTAGVPAGAAGRAWGGGFPRPAASSAARPWPPAPGRYC